MYHTVLIDSDEGNSNTLFSLIFTSEPYKSAFNLSLLLKYTISINNLLPALLRIHPPLFFLSIPFTVLFCFCHLSLRSFTWLKIQIFYLPPRYPVNFSCLSYRSFSCPINYAYNLFFPYQWNCSPIS